MNSSGVIESQEGSYQREILQRFPLIMKHDVFTPLAKSSLPPPLIPIESPIKSPLEAVSTKNSAKFSISSILARDNEKFSDTSDTELGKTNLKRNDTGTKKPQRGDDLIPNMGNTITQRKADLLEREIGKSSSVRRSYDRGVPSYTCMIGQAILSSQNQQVTLGEIYEFIERNFPAIEDKVKGWRNCVRHNLSLNECFVKVGPSRHGRGNNWTVHPSYVESFLRGQFRKRMAYRRKRYQVVSAPPWGNTLADKEKSINRSIIEQQLPRNCPIGQNTSSYKKDVYVRLRDKGPMKGYLRSNTTVYGMIDSFISRNSEEEAGSTACERKYNEFSLPTNAAFYPSIRLFSEHKRPIFTTISPHSIDMDFKPVSSVSNAMLLPNYESNLGRKYLLHFPNSAHFRQNNTEILTCKSPKEQKHLLRKQGC